jgi:hypothetical protein
MESAVSLHCSEEPVSETYPKPMEFNPHPVSLSSFICSCGWIYCKIVGNNTQ